MRYRWLQSFDHIRILDLHGNTKKKERGPDGSMDENVFDIQQGVAISLCSTVQHATSNMVQHAEYYGSQSTKYSMLAQNSVSTSIWTTVSPHKPFYLFSPQDGDLRDEYACYSKITDAMPVHSLGVVTARDHLCINWDKKATWSIRNYLANLDVTSCYRKRTSTLIGP